MRSDIPVGRGQKTQGGSSYRPQPKRVNESLPSWMPTPLLSESHQLTTFITPFGRYHFNKLPFGTSSAPELFQRRMSAILEGVEGVVCLIDELLVIGKDEAEHDTRLM